MIRRMEEARRRRARSRSQDDALNQSRRDEILNELFSRYHSRVAAWCFRTTGDRGAAADLAQDVLLKAAESGFLERTMKFSTWMYSIMRNHCINERAARSVRPEGASDPLDFEVSDQSSPAGQAGRTKQRFPAHE